MLTEMAHLFPLYFTYFSATALIGDLGSLRVDNGSQLSFSHLAVTARLMISYNSKVSDKEVKVEVLNDSSFCGHLFSV